MSSAWGAADLFNGVMAAVNLPAVLLLSGKVFRLTRSYKARKFGGSREKPMLSAYPDIQSQLERRRE